jgi:hypothetical protein
MSGDEFIVLVLSAIVAAFAWYRWYAAATVRALVNRNASRFIFIVAPVACSAMLFLVLRWWAADDVRNSGTYLLFYMVAGAAWIGACGQLLSLLGISPRDDAVERQNLAAAFATAGALAGITFCFAGANVGNGPGWWVVVFSAGLSTGAFFVLWALVENLTGISERITIERADGAGLRLAGFLIAMGMILGRAAAGDWVSAEATVRDFVMVAWPVMPLAGAAVVVERVSPYDVNAHTEDSLVGLLVAGIFVALSSLYVFVWQGAP